MQFRFGRHLQAVILKGAYATVNGALAIVRKLMWPSAMPKSAAKICIYRIGNVGDTVCAIPAMYAIRRTFPDARITVLTSPGERGAPGAKELVGESNWIDDVRCYYRDDVDSLGKRYTFIRNLRAEGFDAWFELSNDDSPPRVVVRNMIMAKLAGVRWGYGWHINTIRCASKAQSEHISFPNEVERLLGILSKVGILCPASFPIHIDDDIRSDIDDALRKAQFLGGRLAAIAPGAKREMNRWPVERYAQIAKDLVEDNWNVVLIGAGQDYQACELIMKTAGRAAANFAGRFSLIGSCELLRRCDLVVCNDSGVQHLAAAVGTPCVSLFSSRYYKGKWSPYGDRNVVIQKQVDCHTCLLEECPYDNRCIKLIGTEEVRTAINGMNVPMESRFVASQAGDRPC